MSLRAGRALTALLLCTACFGGAAAESPAPAAPVPAGGEAEAEVAPTPAPQPSDAEIAAFSQRIESFYSQLQDIPLDTLSTYENRELRSCFASQSAFSDYFSALATEARDMYFRDVTARKVRIREFHFEGPEQAGVDVTFTSVHQREIRFWSIGFDRHDTWHLNDGIWQIVPDKL